VLTLNDPSFFSFDDDLQDDLLYYHYSVKHLLRLENKGITPDAVEFINAYRSFEGEVFENFLYEKLLRLIPSLPDVTKFVLKGPHLEVKEELPSTLSANKKGQIVYRTRYKEIGEYDSLIFTEKELYFVEMTLVGSAASLRKRMPKKKGLLELLFPHLEIKALLILTEGVVGTKILPDFCTVWTIKPYDARRVYEWLKDPSTPRRPLQPIENNKVINALSLSPKPFDYYRNLTWVLRKMRGSTREILDSRFMKSRVFTRYHDVFTKVYIGFMGYEDFISLYDGEPIAPLERVYVAIEKEANGVQTLCFFASYSRKNLEYITIKNRELKSAKKDAFGMTVTEVAHMKKVMNDEFILKPSDLQKIEPILHKLSQGS
jgi:hypothetical protein